MQQPNRIAINGARFSPSRLPTNKRMITNATNKTDEEPHTIEARIKHARRQRTSNCPLIRARSVSVPWRYASVNCRARSIARPRRFVMDNSSSPTPDIRITGPMATCNVGTRFCKRKLLNDLKPFSTAGMPEFLPLFPQIARLENPQRRDHARNQFRRRHVKARVARAARWVRHAHIRALA